MGEKLSKFGDTIKKNKKDILAVTRIGVVCLAISYISSFVGTHVGYAKGYKAGSRDTFNDLNTLAKTISNE